MARGRKAINGKAMTAAERQQRRRDKLKGALPPFGSEARFRLELFQWVQAQAPFYGDLDAAVISRALDELGDAVLQDAYTVSEPGRALTKEHGWQEHRGRCISWYLTGYPYERPLQPMGVPVTAALEGPASAD